MEYDCKGEVRKYNICGNVCIHTLFKMVSIGKNLGRYCIWEHICICIGGAVWSAISEKSLNMDSGNSTFCVGCAGIFDMILVNQVYKCEYVVYNVKYLFDGG